MSSMRVTLLQILITFLTYCAAVRTVIELIRRCSAWSHLLCLVTVLCCCGRGRVLTLVHSGRGALALAVLFSRVCYYCRAAMLRPTLARPLTGFPYRHCEHVANRLLVRLPNRVSEHPTCSRRRALHRNHKSAPAGDNFEYLIVIHPAGSREVCRAGASSRVRQRQIRGE